MADEHKTTLDDEYKNAIQPVVDDAMRTDTLGAKFCSVLNEHKPTDEAIKKIMATAIENDQNVKKAITNTVNEIDNKRKVKWIDRLVSLAIGALITGLIGLGLSQIGS